VGKVFIPVLETEIGSAERSDRLAAPMVRPK
jgi:hypothetical protein